MTAQKTAARETRDTRDDFNGFIPFHASGMAETVFGLSLHLTVETRMTLSRRNRFESA